MGSSNTFSKALRHLKVSKPSSIHEEVPTNNTQSLYRVSPDTTVETHPGIDQPDFGQDGDGSSGYDGKDTSGLFMPDGTIKTVEPPGDTSYILGPMSSMWYAWGNFTQIGYIRQSDRKMVNLGRITGELQNWDKVSNFTSYGQLTLDQAAWFCDEPKYLNGYANYRAFYPGPPSNTPDAFGRYYCTLTGTPKNTKKGGNPPNTGPEGGGFPWGPGSNPGGNPGGPKKPKPKGGPRPPNLTPEGETKVNNGEPLTPDDFNNPDDYAAFKAGGGNAALSNGQTPAEVVGQGDANLTPNNNTPTPRDSGGLQPGETLASLGDGTFVGLDAKELAAFKAGGGTAAIESGKSLRDVMSQGYKNQKAETQKAANQDNLRDLMNKAPGTHTPEEEQALLDAGLDDFVKGGMKTTDIFGDIATLAGAALAVKGGLAVAGNALVQGILSFGVHTGRTLATVKTAELVSDGLTKIPGIVGDANSSGDYNTQLAAKLPISILTGTPQEIKLSDAAKKDQINNVSPTQFEQALQIGQAHNPSANTTVNPTPELKKPILTKTSGWGAQGGSEVHYDPKTDTLTITSEKMLRTGQKGDEYDITQGGKSSGGQVIDPGKQTKFGDIPDANPEVVADITRTILGVPGVVDVGAFLGSSEYQAMKDDPGYKEDVIKRVSQQANDLTSYGVQGVASNVVALRKALTNIGLLPKSEVEETGGGYGQVYSQTSYKGNEIPQELRDIINNKTGTKSESFKPLPRLPRRTNKVPTINETSHTLDVIRNVKNPVVIEEKKEKVKRRPRVIGSEPRTINSGLMKQAEVPASFKKPEERMWGKYEREQNARASQDRKNVVLDHLGSADQAWEYLLDRNAGKRSFSGYFDKDGTPRTIFTGGKVKKVTREEKVGSDTLIFFTDEEGKKGSILQSEYNELQDQAHTQQMFAEYEATVAAEEENEFDKIANRLEIKAEKSPTNDKIKSMLSSYRALSHLRKEDKKQEAHFNSWKSSIDGTITSNFQSWVDSVGQETADAVKVVDETKRLIEGMTSGALFQATLPPQQGDLQSNSVGSSSAYTEINNGSVSGSGVSLDFSGSPEVGNTHTRWAEFRPTNATQFDTFVTNVTVGSGPSQWYEPREHGGSPTHSFPGGFRVVMYSKSREGDFNSYVATELTSGTNTITIPSNLRVSDLVVYYIGIANSDPLNGGVTGTHTISSASFQRRNPMNVFVPLDSPEAINFIRTAPMMQGLTPAERLDKLKQMLKAGNKYLLQALGYTGSTATPGDDIQLASHDKPFSRYPAAGGNDRWPGLPQDSIKNLLHPSNDPLINIPITPFGLPKDFKVQKGDTRIAAGGVPRGTGGKSAGDPENIQWPRNRPGGAQPGPGYRPPKASKRQPQYAHYEPEGKNYLSDSKTFNKKSFSNWYSSMESDISDKVIDDTKKLLDEKMSSANMFNVTLPAEGDVDLVDVDVNNADTWYYSDSTGTTVSSSGLSFDQRPTNIFTPNWSLYNITTEFDATLVNSLEVSVTTGTGIDAPLAANPLKVEWVSDTDYGLLGTFSAGGGTQVFQLPKEANVKNLILFYSVSGNGNTYRTYTDEYLVGKSIFGGDMDSDMSQSAMSILEAGATPSPFPPNYPTSQDVKELYGFNFWIDALPASRVTALRNGSVSGPMPPSWGGVVPEGTISAGFTTQDSIDVYNAIHSSYSSYNTRASNLYTITATNFKRTTPMNVFVSLDSPEAINFIRTDPSMRGLTPAQRVNKLKKMLKNGNKYLLQALGYSGSTATPGPNEPADYLDGADELLNDVSPQDKANVEQALSKMGPEYAKIAAIPAALPLLASPAGQAALALGAAAVGTLLIQAGINVGGTDWGAAPGRDTVGPLPGTGGTSGGRTLTPDQQAEVEAAGNELRDARRALNDLPADATDAQKDMAQERLDKANKNRTRVRNKHKEENKNRKD